MVVMSEPLRLTPAFLHIMLSVADQPLHGYAVMQAVEERTAGTVKLGPGSLYWAVKRLVEAEYLEEVPGRDDASHRRRYYRLTRVGRKVLRDELHVLADIVGYAESQNLIRRPSK